MNQLISNYYKKSIRLTPDGFSLYEMQENGSLQQAHYPTAENALITNKAPEFFGMSNDSSQSVDVIIATKMPMLIPDIIFDESRVMDYLQMQFDISQMGKCFSEQLGHYRSLSFITQNESDTIRELPCQANCISEASLLYQFLLEQNMDEAVLLSVNDSFADILAMQHNEPLLINRTKHVENVDILYYTLNSVQQLGMRNPTLFVNYFGKANKKLNDLLAQYVDNIILL